MSRQITARLDLELSGEGGGWTDKTADMDLSAGVQWGRELPGDSPTDRVMAVPWLSLALNNSDRNSASLEGLYSLGHANKLAGFGIGTGIRLTIVITAPDWVEPGWVEPGFAEEGNNEIAIWTGEISDVDPDPGKYLSRLSRVQALGYMDQLDRARLSGLNILEGANESDVFAAVIAAMAKQPRALEIQPGPDTYDYALDQSRGDRIIPTTECQRLGQSSYVTIFERGDGTLVYEPRTSGRAVSGNPLTPALSLTEADFDVLDPPDIDEERRDAPNVVKLSMIPRRVDGAAVVIASLGSPFAIEPGDTETVVLRYRDPNDLGTAAGGTGGVTPVASTDYVLNAEQDGSGSDLTGDANVAYTFGPTSVSCQIENTSAETAWVTTLQARAIGVYSQDDLEVKKTGTTTGGEIPLEYRMPYQSEFAVLDAMAQWHLDKLEPGGTRIRRLPIPLVPTRQARALAILQTPFSSVVSVQETISGLDGTERFHLDGKSGEIRPDGTIWFYPKLSPAFDGPFIEFPTETNAPSLLVCGGDWQAATVYQTISVAPEADQLLVLDVNSGMLDGTNPSKPTITGLGLTWVEDSDVFYNSAGQSRFRLTRFRSMSVGATPTAGKITITYGSEHDRASWCAIQFPNVDTGGTWGSAAIVQSVTATGTGASATATLAAFGSANNRPLVASGGIAGKQHNPESGWTLLGRRIGSPPIMAAWRNAVDLTATVNISGTANKFGVIASEIKAA